MMHLSPLFSSKKIVSSLPSSAGFFLPTAVSSAAWPARQISARTMHIDCAWSISNSAMTNIVKLFVIHATDMHDDTQVRRISAAHHPNSSCLASDTMFSLGFSPLSPAGFFLSGRSKV